MFRSESPEYYYDDGVFVVGGGGGWERTLFCFGRYSFAVESNESFVHQLLCSNGQRCESDLNCYYKS